MPVARLRRAVPLLLAAAVAGAVAAVPGTAQAASETVVGTLVQAWPEHEQAAEAAARGSEGPLSWIETEHGGSVRVPTGDLQASADVPVGATVQVTVGRTVHDEASREDDLAPARDVLAATVVEPAPSVPGTAPADPALTDEVTVVMVAPRGSVRDGTPAQAVVDAVDGPVAAFWNAQSDGAIRIGVTASHDWRTAQHSCSDPVGLWDEVAAGIHWPGGAGKHLVVYVPRTAPGCAYGLGEVGSSLSSGGRLYVQDTATSVLAHELGHNFGLGHSSELQCNGVVEDGGCPAGAFTSAYNDWYDVMGFSWERVGTLNVVQADRLGLLPAAEKTRVDTWAPTATYALAPVSAATGLRGVELVDPTGAQYWLEYRQASGQDDWLATSANWPGLQTGVVLHRADPAPYAPNSSLLLDGTPSPAARWGTDRQSVLPVGAAVPVGLGDFTVTVQSVGATAVVRVSPGASPAGARYAATGGPAGPLGVPIRPLVCGLRGGGCFRPYAAGSIYWSPGTAASVVTGRIRDRWGSLGWEVGALGYPVADATCGLPDAGCGQPFQGGSLYGSASTGTYAVRGAIGAKWLGIGGPSGALGYPTSDELCGLVRGGCFQLFQRGSVYWSPTTGAQLVSGAVRDRWASTGWERGPLGYPLGDTTCGIPGGGCSQSFQGGWLYSSPSTGTRVVRGALGAAWVAVGGAGGSLGYPTSDDICGLVRGGCFQLFARGSVYWSAATGAHAVSGPVHDRWAVTGWERGWLGYPVADAVCGLPDNGCGQDFQGGSVYDDDTTEAHPVRGALRDRWLASGGAPVVGTPIMDDYCGLVGGGCFQYFRNGAVYWSPVTGAHTVSGRLLSAWEASGWERGALGYPVEEARTVGADVVQRFQRGTLTYVAAEDVVRAS